MLNSQSVTAMTAILSALLLFTSQGSQNSAEAITINASASASISTSFPMDRQIVERRVYVTPKPGGDDEGRTARFFVDIENSDRNFRLSLSLLSMACDATSGSSLKITGDDEVGQNVTASWCSNVLRNQHHIPDGFVVQGDTSYTVRVAGDWSNAEAYLLVTIYYEATSCTDCDSSSFCCSSDRCAPADGYQTRCISKDLRCNGYPNCGMICNNADEAGVYLGTACGKSDGKKLRWNWNFRLLLLCIYFVIYLYSF